MAVDRWIVNVGDNGRVYPLKDFGPTGRSSGDGSEVDNAITGGSSECLQSTRKLMIQQTTCYLPS